MIKVIHGDSKEMLKTLNFTDKTKIDKKYGIIKQKRRNLWQ